MFKKTALIAGIGLALSATAQADYQWELDAAYSTGDIEIGPVDADQDVLNLNGAYFLEAVDISKGPLGEAAFLDRASFVGFDYSNGEIDTDAGDLDVSAYGANGRYVMKDSGWLVDLGYRQDELENEEVDTFSIGGGKYILENTTVVLSYANADADSSGEADIYGVDVEHLWNLEQGAVKVEAGYAYSDFENLDEANIYAVAGTYYLTNSLSFGASYSLSDSDDAEIDSYSVFGEWFIKEQAVLSLAYESSEDDNSSLESDAIIASARVRF